MSERTIDDSSENNEVILITAIDIPIALGNLCISKSYFSNGLVTIRDCPITINDVKMHSHSHKVPNKSHKRKKGAEVRLFIEDGVI